MNNTAAIILTLAGMTVLDVFLVGPHRRPEPRSNSVEAITTLAELQPAMQHLAVVGNPSPERARRLFETWGEWRLGRVGARQSALRDPRIDAPRVFPTPAWADPDPGPPVASSQRRP
jgi:hypothetical protein